jgi:gp16 family phage-associated protein
MKQHKINSTVRLDGIRPEDIARVRREMNEAGISQSAWAKANGFTRQQVADVLTGRRLCLRGASHAVAVALGLKKGRIVKAAHFKPVRLHQGATA